LGKYIDRLNRRVDVEAVLYDAMMDAEENTASGED
jgi:hypothetical protein